MASTYLTKTFSSGGNQRIWTSSFWVKLNIASGEDNYIYTYAQSSGATPRGSMEFRSDANGNTFRVGFNPTGSSWINCDVDNRKFRDYSAFYHVVVAVDTTQATASNRVKIYINGEQETVSTQPSQNFDTGFNHTHQTSFGRYENADSSYFNGVLSHINFIDGTQYTASTFGESDSVSGIWVPKTSPSVTYGSNGFFLKFENSGAMGTDSSGNSNTFAVGGGTLTQNVDTPSNNFATFNPLKDGRMNGSTQYKATFTNGNTTSTFAESTYNTGAFSSLAVNSGKYYAEIKCSNAGGNTKLGLFSADDYGSDDFSGTYLYDSSGTFGGSSYGNSFTTGDIIQIAFDATNGTVWFGKNGTWQDSATQSEIEAGTTTNSATTGIDMTQFWHLGTYGVNATAFQANFGQGYFGTTAVASAGTAPSEGGIFEYNCPSGFQALCTKGINSF